MISNTFRGSPAEIGRAQGLVNPDAALAHLNELLDQPHNFESRYFRENLAFTQREFPDLMEQIQAFGEAAGMESLEQAFYSHIYHTGDETGDCSAFGLLLEDDGPAMLTTNDTAFVRATSKTESTTVSIFPDAKPHGFMGVSNLIGVAVDRSVNDAGLVIGAASGHRRFNPVNNPECLNLYFILHLLAQHCADCQDVRKFVEQYRLSGIKGFNLVAVDADGNILGVELESENIAISEAQDGMLLEVNHYQHPKLQAPSRQARPEYWDSASYYNSQARVQYIEQYRQVFARMRTIDDLIDFSFDFHAPGRLIQLPDRNVSNMVSCQVVFLTAANRTMRIHLHPVDKADYEVFQLPQ